jgi:hypothetical protein
MDISENPEFTAEDTLNVFAYAGVTQNFIKSAADKLRVANGKCQTGETALDRIRHRDSNILFQEMVAANDALIEKAVRNNEFTKDIVVAMDTHVVYRYSKLGWDMSKRKRECTDIRTIVGTKPKKGTSYAHKYMTIQNLKVKKERPSYVLAFDRMFFGKNDVAPIAEKILIEAESKTGAKVSLVLGDGDFDEIDAMNMFLRRGTHFIVRADQDPKVKEIIMKSRKEGKNFHVEHGYVKGTEDRCVKVNLVVASVEWLSEWGIKYPLVKKKKDRYLSWYTDLKPRKGQSEMKFCVETAKQHKKRWGIETGYRDISEFEAKTHALSDSVRLFLYLQAILLYNIWVQINYMYKDHPDRIRYFRDGIPKSMIKFIIEQISLKGEYEGIEEGPLIK